MLIGYTARTLDKPQNLVYNKHGNKPKGENMKKTKKFLIGSIAVTLAGIMFSQSVPVDLVSAFADAIAEVLTKEETIERKTYATGDMVDAYNIGNGYILQENIKLQKN